MPNFPLETMKGNAVHNIFLLVSALALAGCSSIGMLTPVSPDAPISGIVTRSFLEPYRIEVTLDGKTYRGEWRREPAPEHPLANSYLHKRHVGKVRSILRADDGAQLECSWLVHGYESEGSCVAPDMREFAIGGR